MIEFNSTLDAIIQWNPEHSAKIYKAFNNALNGNNNIYNDLIKNISKSEIDRLNKEVIRLLS